IWNDKLPFQMAWLSNPKAKWINKPNNRGMQRIYYFLSCSLYILQFVSPGHSIKNKLKNLIDHKPNSISLESMGFPSDWKNEDIWND
ncbi:MAG: Abi-like protein, partial [Saprospiraceae bacterium]|nr:Abi-like protein [Bacteroidia bacterium]NNL92052.1 Abi-like protein [Saprospiraceae bacterium]